MGEFALAQSESNLLHTILKNVFELIGLLRGNRLGVHRKMSVVNYDLLLPFTRLLTFKSLEFGLRIVTGGKHCFKEFLI